MTRAAPLLLAVAASAALSACSATAGDSLNGTALQRAGGPAGSGGVCAYYSGARGSGRDAFQDVFRRRACFPTTAACRSWLYGVQTRYPVTYLRKGCR